MPLSKFLVISNKDLTYLKLRKSLNVGFAIMIEGSVGLK